MLLFGIYVLRYTSIKLLLVRPHIPENYSAHAHQNNRNHQHGSTQKRQHLRPALVANWLRESSLSPCERTCPQSANEVELFKARPLASTSTTLIWTDAWSLEVIRRSATQVDRIAPKHTSLAALTSGRTLAGDVEINEDTLHSVY